MPFWGQRKIVNLAFWSLVISHFVTFHTLLICVISRSHVTIWSCTLHWFTREDAECVPDHEPIRHRELLEAHQAVDFTFVSGTSEVQMQALCQCIV